MPKPSKSSTKTGATISLNAFGGNTGGGGNGGNNPQPNTPTPQAQPIADQTPTPANTPVTPNGVDALTKMSDDELATLINSAVNVDMPNYLADIPNATQNFVFVAGLNEKPEVLDQADFDKYMKDNNIPKSHILSRSVSGGDEKSASTPTVYNKTTQQVIDVVKYSRLNYVGGKKGGSVHGSGTYFDMNGGGNTGYASGGTFTGVLSKNAKVIDDGRSFIQKQQAWINSHPKANAAIRRLQNSTSMTGSKSIYALLMGYNVIRSGSYHNIIDRSALVLVK